MNYTHNTVLWLLNTMRDLITWLFSVELVNYEGVSISFGSAFVYFFIVYLVISLLLNAKVALSRERIIEERKNKYD